MQKLLFLLFTAVLLLSACNKKPEINEKYARLGGDFTLTTLEGEKSLSDYRDKLSVLFFGFTACPDYCPSTLLKLNVVLQDLTPSQREQFRPIMIGVDTTRDTPEVIQSYVDFFIETPKGVGMTGNEQELKQVARQFAAFFEVVDLPDSELGYTMAHSIKVYLINKTGNVLEIIDFETPVEQVKEILLQHI